MGKFNKLFMMVSALLFSVGVQAMDCTVDGNIYFKNGKVLSFTDENKLDIPHAGSDVTAYKDYYSAERKKITYAAKDIIYIECWHPGHPDITYKFKFLKDGRWYWEYMHFDHINVLVYSTKGYYINNQGGTTQNRGNIIGNLTTKVAFYLEQPGEEPKSLGEAYKNSNSTFINNICEYISTDPDTCEKIRKSKEKNRSKVLQLLAFFNPQTKKL